MNKKGVSFEITMWIIRLILIGIMLYFLSVILNTGTKSLLDTHNLDYAILLERPLYSPHGFVYNDETTQRTYPNIIDPSKFTETILQQVFTGSKPFAVKYDLDGTIIYYNKEQFEIMKPLTWSEKYGEWLQTKTVLVKEENKLIPKTMVMNIVFEK